MDSIVVACAGLVSACLGVWVALGLAARRFDPVAVDRAAAVTFFAVALTALAAFRMVVVGSTPESGPLPVFVFLGVPLGLLLGWLGLRLARERAARR